MNRSKLPQVFCVTHYVFYIDILHVCVEYVTLSMSDWHLFSPQNILMFHQLFSQLIVAHDTMFKLSR